LLLTINGSDLIGTTYHVYEVCSTWARYKLETINRYFSSSRLIENTQCGTIVIFFWSQ